MSTGAKDRFKRAELAAKKGNLEYAIELYLQGLTLDPKAAERRRLHEIESMSIEESGGNPEGGMGVKMKTIGILGKIKKHSLAKKFDEMVPELENALRFQPRNGKLLLDLADALVKMEAQDGAIDVLGEVVSYDGQNVDALRRLGQLWAEDDIEKAVEYWEKVKMIKPEDKEASKAIRDLSAANMVKRSEERKAKSGDDSFQALLADEGQAADLEKASKVIRTDADRREAIKRKKDELRSDPKNSRFWRELGGLYQDLKEWKFALAAFKKALEVNPHDMFARDRIGMLKEGRAREQLDQLRGKVQANGGASAELQQQLVDAEAKFLAFQTGEYGRRVKEHPTDCELKMRYGNLLLESGLYDEAIEQFQKSIKDPKFKVESKNKMGRCFQSKGVHAVAIAQYTEALSNCSDPDSEIAKEIRYNLAVANQESGDKDTALQFYQEIMAVDIGYRDISARVDELMNA